MIITLLLVELALCAAIVHREVVRLQFRNLATSLFFGVYTLVFVLEPLLLHSVFGGARRVVFGVEDFFQDDAVYWLFHVYGTALLLTALWLGRRQEARADAIVPIEPRLRSGDQTLYLGLLIVVGVAMYVQSTGMGIGELLVASRFAWFEERGFSIFWITVSSYFMALIGLYVYRERLCGKHHWLVIAITVGAIVLHGAISRDRKWVIYLVSGWIAAQYESSGRKLAVSRRAALFFAALLFVLVISQFIRDVIFRMLIGERLDLFTEFGAWQSRLIEFGDISYFYRASLEAIHQNINSGVLFPFALARRVLFFFLPAGYSGGLKVEDISATFSDVVNGNDAVRRGNMPPGLFGLFVISFGWFASLFLIPLLAWLLRKIDGLFRYARGNFREALLSLWIFCVVLAFRGDDSSALYFVISTYLFVVMERLARMLTRPGLPFVGSVPGSS